jgi:hypothetical protein
MAVDATPLNEKDLKGPNGRPSAEEIVDWFFPTLKSVLTAASNSDQALETLAAGLQTQITNFALPPINEITANTVAGGTMTFDLGAAREFDEIAFNEDLTINVVSAGLTSGYREGSLTVRNGTGLSQLLTMPQGTVPLRMAGHTSGDIVYSVAPREIVQFYFQHARRWGFILVTASEGVSIDGSTTGGRSGLGTSSGGGSGGSVISTHQAVFQVTAPGDDNYFFNQTSFVGNVNAPEIYLDSSGAIKTFMLMNKISGDDIPTSGITPTSVVFSAVPLFSSGTAARSARFRMFKNADPTLPSTAAAHDARTYTSAAFNYSRASGLGWDPAQLANPFTIDLGTPGINMINELVSVATSPINKILLVTDNNGGLGDMKFESRDVSASSGPKLTVTWTQ